MRASPRPHITALLTGRGGSTLKDKNVLTVLGKPLLSYPAKAALKSTLIDDFYVSSDDSKILNTAAALGFKQIRRPVALARSTAQHSDVIRHALVKLERDGIKPDIVVVILANSVTLTTRAIDDCLKEMLKDETLSCVAPMYENSDHHPFRAKKINKNGLCEPFFDLRGKNVSTNRQDLEPSYFFCHNFWVLRTTSVKKGRGQKPWIFMGERIKPYMMKEPALDVHERGDIKASEQWLKKYGK